MLHASTSIAAPVQFTTSLSFVSQSLSLLLRPEPQVLEHPVQLLHSPHASTILSIITGGDAPPGCSIKRSCPSVTKEKNYYYGMHLHIK